MQHRTHGVSNCDIVCIGYLVISYTNKIEKIAIEFCMEAMNEQFGYQI